MRIQQVSSGVGATVDGVDVRNLNAEEQAAIDAAWAEHGVLFIRGQDLKPDDHLAFATRFAPVDTNKYFASVDGYPDVAQVLKEPDHLSNIGGAWHADHTYDEHPARGSVLYALEVPSTGGDTMFADASAAAAALSPGMREMLRGLRAVHTNADVFSAEALSYPDNADRLKPGPLNTTTHPVLATHPITGRDVIFVNPGFTRHFEGWTVAESRPLLQQLYDHVSQHQFTTRFSWEPGSIAMWDNRSVWHWAINDYAGHRRLLHRVTIQGTAIEAAAA